MKGEAHGRESNMKKEEYEPKCMALGCEFRGELMKFIPWNKNEKEHEDYAMYYCKKHFISSYAKDQESLNTFLEYYKDSMKREWLPPKSLELYNKYSNK